MKDEKNIPLSNDLKQQTELNLLWKKRNEEYVKLELNSYKKIQTNSKGKDENQIIRFFNEEEDLKEFFFIKAGHKLKMFYEN